MRRHNARNDDVANLRENQEKLVAALRRLFERLEEYAPTWYTQELHDMAFDALASVNRRSVSSIRHRLKDAA
jgi:hypothetical protein